MHFQTNSLATQASLAVFSISLLGVIALSTIQLLYDYDDEVDKVTSQFESLESSVLSIVRCSLWTYDQDQLRSILLGLKTLPYISYVAIANQGNVIMSQGEKPKSPISRRDDIHSPAAPLRC